MRCFVNLAVIAVLAASAPASGQSPTVVSLSESTNLHFVNAETGRKLIVEQDDFMQRMQDLERQIRMESQTPVTKEQYFESLQVGVREWTPEGTTALKEAIAEVKNKLSGFDLPLPEKINLIRVAAGVEADAPHCRGASIILPDSFFGKPEKMARIMVHELFHVMSSHNPELRDRLYSIIGFSKCNEIDWPEALDVRRLTNPDAPIHQHYISITNGEAEAKIAVAPITMCKSERNLPGGLFRNLEFQLLVLEQVDGRFVPKVVDGDLQIVAPQDAEDYMRQIGRNTGYIIHPEETLADNFTLLIMKNASVRDPWILEKLADALKK